MPLYEYRCSGCGKVFEVIQKFSDPPLTVHEGCGGKVERLLSAPALQFKGSGWYITDYARSGSKSEDKSSQKKTDSKQDGGKTENKSSESKSPESKPAESKAESKPAPKPD